MIMKRIKHLIYLDLIILSYYLYLIVNIIYSRKFQNLLIKFFWEKNEIELRDDEEKKEGDKKIFYNYLINNINRKTNFKVKLIYLDLYFNVIAPKSEILNKVDIIKMRFRKQKRIYLIKIRIHLIQNRIRLM